MRYYLAYGSNLDIERMRARCPGATRVGKARVKDYQLVFKNYLTIEPAEGEMVPLGVWKITENDEKRLDVYEGYPNFYTKEEIELDMITREGRIEHIKAFLYIMTDCRTYKEPSVDYFQRCMTGFHNFGFDDNILIHALAITKERMNDGKQKRKNATN